ncbi:hypothetical protein RTG_01875 [Rhodotorula toruloides ATCC 204091]|uniref:Uncharacterized protein n=1 Tax=Rhodotorula toruloides TaxID=5286 RepID=A0A0K3C865_RHOTO|nr:hypothetical protein RTG_01875 [Rhodotorula toruloides ATCC 204091]PRQ76579.1 hypothetical protein AAT19DRAFT_11997 [Rhodotorula toruloides]
MPSSRSADFPLVSRRPSSLPVLFCLRSTTSSRPYRIPATGAPPVAAGTSAASLPLPVNLLLLPFPPYTMSSHLEDLYNDDGHTDDGLQKCIRLALCVFRLHDTSGHAIDTAANGAHHDEWLNYASGPASALLALFRNDVPERSRLHELQRLQGACVAASGRSSLPLYPAAKPLVDFLDGKATTLVIDPHNHRTYYGTALPGRDEPEEPESRFKPGRRFLDRVKTLNNGSSK